MKNITPEIFVKNCKGAKVQLNMSYKRHSGVPIML